MRLIFSWFGGFHSQVLVDLQQKICNNSIIQFNNEPGLTEGSKRRPYSEQADNGGCMASWNKMGWFTGWPGKILKQFKNNSLPRAIFWEQCFLLFFFSQTSSKWHSFWDKYLRLLTNEPKWQRSGEGIKQDIQSSVFDLFKKENLKVPLQTCSYTLL